MITIQSIWRWMANAIGPARAFFLLQKLLAIDVTPLFFLLQIPQIIHQGIHLGRKIIGPGSLMELLHSSGIGNSVIKLILYGVKNISVSLFVYRKVFL